jgi:hypothetical protein
LLQQVYRDSQATHEGQYDQVGRVFGVFCCQVVIENSLKTIDREPQDIKILGVRFDLSRMAFSPMLQGPPGR